MYMSHVYMLLHTWLSLTEQAIHDRDELSGRVQECEEELSMALKELQREQASLKIIKMQNNEVSVCVSMVYSCINLCEHSVSVCVNMPVISAWS